MLRVAVCLSGHMRSFEKAAPTLFEHVCRPGVHGGVLAEYYVHTWTEIGVGDTEFDPDLDLDLNLVNEIYNPCGLSVERFNPESSRSRSMFRKIMLCHRMAVESGREYDLYVRARPDSFFLQSIDLSSLHRRGGITVPSRASFSGICDQFATGNREMMDLYASLLERQSRDDHFHPESRLQSHLHGVDVHRDDSIRFKIMRSNGSLYDTMSLGS